MRAVTTPTIARRALGRLRTAAVVAALAFVSNGAYAAFASVSADLFVSTDPGLFIIVPTPDPTNQNWDLNVFHGGVLVNSNSGNFPDWTPRSGTAQSSQTNASYDSRENTDVLTQLITPGFTVAASATPLNDGLLYEALGQGQSSGGFCLWDPNIGDPSTPNCNGAGSLAFSLFYDLLVSSAPVLGSSASASISVSGLDLPGGILSAFAFADATGTSVLPDPLLNPFTWTANLAAGDASRFTIDGVAYVAAIPEPGVLALAALGLIGLAATRRRNARAVS